MCYFAIIIIDGYIYLFMRGWEGESNELSSSSDSYKNDGINWIKRHNSKATREDYIKHKNGVLCSFKAASYDSNNNVSL